MKLVPLSAIEDPEFFTRGMRFRIYNVGLNVKDKKDEFAIAVGTLKNERFGRFALPHGQKSSAFDSLNKEMYEQYQTF